MFDRARFSVNRRDAIQDDIEIIPTNYDDGQFHAFPGLKCSRTGNLQFDQIHKRYSNNSALRLAKQFLRCKTSELTRCLANDFIRRLCSLPPSIETTVTF